MEYYCSDHWKGEFPDDGECPVCGRRVEAVKEEEFSFPGQRKFLDHIE